MTVVLSPHLDDAVLSAFTRLRPGTLVVNVFDGLPPAGTLSLWDRLCGASDSREQAERRLSEDAAVLDSLGVERRSLGLLDALNRTPDPALDLEEVAHLLDDLALDEFRGRPVYAPLAGGPRPHPDHRLVRDAALGLRRLDAIDELWLYADVPYCVKAGGWPAAWGGSWPDPAWLARTLRETGLGAWWDHLWIQLDPDDADRKLKAMRGYASQYVNLDRKLRVKGLVSNRAIYSAEVYWPVPRPTLPLS